MTDFIDVAQAAPIHVRFRNHELSLSLPGSAAGSLPKLESQILIIGEEWSDKDHLLDLQSKRLVVVDLEKGMHGKLFIDVGVEVLLKVLFLAEWLCEVFAHEQFYDE